MSSSPSATDSAPASRSADKPLRDGAYPIVRAAVGIAPTLVVAIIRCGMEPWLHGRMPFLLFLPAVLFAVWYGGLGSGLAATLVGAMTGTAIMTDDFPWKTNLFDNVLGVAMYALPSVLLCVLVEQQGRAHRRAMAEADERRRSEERLTVTLRGIGDAVIATDERGCIAFMNPIAEELTGWRQEEALGRPSSDVFRICNEVTRDAVESPVARVLREGAIVGLANHTILIAHDGAERPIDDSGAPIRNAAGDVIGAVLVFRDVTERRSAEEAMARLAAIVDTSNDAIITKSLEGVITDWNGGAERLYGYTRDEAVGQPMSLLTAPGCEDETAALLERIKRGDAIANYETVRRRKDGAVIDVSVSLSALHNGYGELIGAASIARDITSERRAADSVRESRELLATTLRSIGDAVIATDMHGRITFMNAVAEQLTGWTQREAAGRDCHEVFRIVNESTGREVESPVTKTLREGRVVGLANHTVLIARDGRETPIDDSGAPICGADGKPIGAVLVFRDISERKLAEERVTRQAELLELASDAMFVHDQSNTITFWNRGAEAMYGWTRDEAIGKVAWELLQTVFPESHEAVVAELERAGYWEGELIHTRRDGVRIVVSSRWSLVRDEAGRPVVALETNREITEQKQHVADIESLNDRLRRAMSETHHRVKNNLQVISALVDMQVMSGASSVPMAQMQRLGQHVRSLAAVHDLLTQEAKANGEADYLQTKQALDQLRPLIDGMVGSRRLLMKVEDVRLPIRQGTALAVLVNELVSNAVKHGEGDIELSLGVEQGWVSLQVCDQGPGFPPGFDARVAANTGLELIQSVGCWDLQGELDFANRATGGARVTVRFPVPDGMAGRP